MTTPTQTHWPTQTGEPALKHPALELADKVGAEIIHTVELDVMHNDAAETIRRLHALVVQMRDALEAGHCVANEMYENAQRAYAGHPNKYAAEKRDVDQIGGALTAANDYLEGQK